MTATAQALSASVQSIVPCPGQSWTGLSAWAAVASAVAAFLTFLIVWKYTVETQKLRVAADKQLKLMANQAELNAKIATAQVALTEETQKMRQAANRQLDIMIDQARLNTAVASAQNVLTFNFSQHVVVNVQPYGTCWAYPVVVEGRGFQNLYAELVSPPSQQKFVLLSFHDHKGAFASLAGGTPEISHVLLWVPLQDGGMSRGTATRFRFTYVDALRNSRWDEFTFKDAGEWQPKWIHSGVTIASAIVTRWDTDDEIECSRCHKSYAADTLKCPHCGFPSPSLEG